MAKTLKDAMEEKSNEKLGIDPAALELMSRMSGVQAKNVNGEVINKHPVPIEEEKTKETPKAKLKMLEPTGTEDKVETQPEEDEEEPKDYEELEMERIERLLPKINETNFYESGYVEYFKFLDPERQMELLDVSKKELATVTDAIVMGGYYEKEYTLRKQVKMVLRTRETEAYMNIIDNVNQGGISRWKVMEVLALQNCAASIISYGTQVFKPLSDFPTAAERETEFTKRVDFLMGLSAALYNIISTHVVKFDLLVRLASSPYGLENF